MILKTLPPLEINSWTEESLHNLARKISNIVPKPLILIDGIAGSGKTTLAKKLVNILNANLVHSDDVSWNADPIHWDSEMLTNIVNPWFNGNDVNYKPTGWVKENRPGSIHVDPNKALVIEGMGVCRETLRAIATYSIWVYTEPNIARERVIKRDLSNGENGGTTESITEFANWWDSLLTPLFLEEEPWKYADVIVSGFQSNLVSNHKKYSLRVSYKKISY